MVYLLFSMVLILVCGIGMSGRVIFLVVLGFGLRVVSSVMCGIILIRWLLVFVIVSGRGDLMVGMNRFISILFLCMFCSMGLMIELRVVVLLCMSLIVLWLVMMLMSCWFLLMM